MPASKKTTAPRDTSLSTAARARALKHVEQLMAIPGSSGQEAGVADYVRQKLLAAGAKPDWIRTDSAHKKTPRPSDTGNLVLKLPGTLKGPRRLLMAHMDTVPICVGTRPVREKGYFRSGNPLTGLGADDRSGCAVLLTAALEILTRELPHPPLTFLWCIQEEVGLYGARYVQPAFLGHPQLAFNWDGGPPEKLTVGATSGHRFDIEIQGQASHAGVAPELGVSAIAIAALAIADLVRGGWHGLIERDGQRGTANVGVIHGGEATNVVTDRVLVRAEARSHNPKFRQRIVREIEQAFARAAAEVKNSLGAKGKVNIEGRLDYEAFRLADNDASVLAAEAAVRAVGLAPLRSTTNGGLDANWMYQHGIPTVTLGCGQQNIHMTSERLDVGQFESACRIALLLATSC